MRRLTSFCFLASLFCVTFEKIHWNFAGTVSLADVLAILFLVSFVASTKRATVPRTTVVLLGFFGAFLLVYLAGYFNLTDSDSLQQWAKGLAKWLIHFAFLAAAVVWISRRGQWYFWRALGWFSAGIVVNALYVVLQLRRKAYAARFTNVALLGTLVPKRPGWRRHLAFAVVALGMATLVVSLAVPSTEVRVPRERATVIMAVDVSLSMQATDIEPDGFRAMQSAAKQFVDVLPKSGSGKVMWRNCCQPFAPSMVAASS